MSFWKMQSLFCEIWCTLEPKFWYCGTFFFLFNPLKFVSLDPKFVNHEIKLSKIGENRGNICEIWQHRLGKVCGA